MTVEAASSNPAPLPGKSLRRGRIDGCTFALPAGVSA